MDKKASKDTTTHIIAYADKSILKISNVSIKGLDTAALEKILMKKLNTVVRVIGVTAQSIEMDIYNFDPEDILQNQEGIIKAASLAEGFKAQNILELSADKAVEVDIDKIDSLKKYSCARERWLLYECGDNSDGK